MKGFFFNQNDGNFKLPIAMLNQHCWYMMSDLYLLWAIDTFLVIFKLILPNLREKKNYHSTYLHIHFNLFSRSLPKLTAHEDEGVHQNPQYTGQHHFHPVVHDHDFCERVVINVSPSVYIYFRNTSIATAMVFFMVARDCWEISVLSWVKDFHFSSQSLLSFDISKRWASLKTEKIKTWKVER